MGTLQVLLWLGLTGYSIYSAIAYASRRRGNDVAFKSLLKDASPARSMTAEERTTLETILLAMGTKPAKLARDGGVFALSGAFVRHSLTTQGSTAEHNTLGGVDVLMPYDAMDFIDASNRAEVVLTDKFAIVLTLNGEFDLAGARARALLKQREDRQWQAGQPGAMADAAGVPAGDLDPAADHAVILGQRDETPAEVLERSKPGTGFLAALALLAGFGAVALGSRSLDGLSWAWIAPGLVLLGLAAWLAWHRPALRAPQKVNRVRGRIVPVLVTRPGNSVQSRLILGDKFIVDVPAHWKAAVPLGDAPVEVELRVDDSSMLRFGSALSVDDEVRRIAPVYWGRPVWVAIASAIALAVLFFTADSLRADVAHARSTLRARGVRELATPADVRADPPASGRMVHARGDMRCALDVTLATASLPDVDCTRLRWGAAPVTLAPFAASAALEAFASGDVVGAQSNSMMDAIAAMQGTADPVAMALGRGSRVSLIADVGEMVDQVEAVCATPTIPAGCDELRKALVADVGFQIEPSPKDWADLLRLEHAGKLVGEDNIAAVNALSLTMLRSHASAVADGVLEQGMLAELRKTLPKRLEGVVDFTGVPLPPSPSDDNATSAVVPGSPQRWQAWTEALAASGAHPRDVAGMVVGSASASDGRWTLEIDATRQAANADVAIARVALVLLALVLLVVGVVQGTLRIRRAAERGRLLAAHAAERARSLAVF